MLANLQALIAALKGHDYGTAFRLIVAILSDVANQLPIGQPIPAGVAAALQQPLPQSMDQHIDALEEFVREQKSAGPKTPGAAAALFGGGKLLKLLPTLISLLKLVLSAGAVSAAPQSAPNQP